VSQANIRDVPNNNNNNTQDDIYSAIIIQRPMSVINERAL